MALEGWEQASAGDQQRRVRTGYGRYAWKCCVFYWEEPVRRLHQSLCEVAGNADLAGWVGLEEPFEMGSCLIDGTCLEADMHFPTDWVLLKDVASTLLKAIKLIRQAGSRLLTQQAIYDALAPPNVGKMVERMKERLAGRTDPDQRI